MSHENTSRYRSGLRAASMIDAAHHRDSERFGRLYRDAESCGENDRKWTMLQLASACASVDVAGLNKLIALELKKHEREESRRYSEAVIFAVELEESGAFDERDWERFEQHWGTS